MEGVTYVAEPFGVFAAATPTTNPTSTVMFKSLISLKTRTAATTWATTSTTKTF
jgi:acyl-CoA reductase-like NAD-dependent aldehyde dehydrogenase